MRNIENGSILKCKKSYVISQNVLDKYCSKDENVRVEKVGEVFTKLKIIDSNRIFTIPNSMTQNYFEVINHA